MEIEKVVGEIALAPYVDACPEPLLLVDGEGRTVAASESFRRLFAPRFVPGSPIDALGLAPPLLAAAGRGQGASGRGTHPSGGPPAGDFPRYRFARTELPGGAFTLRAVDVIPSQASLFDEVPIGLGIIAQGPPGGVKGLRIVRANKAAERLSRRSLSEAEGRPLLEVFPALKTDGTAARLLAALRSGSNEEMEVRYPADRAATDRYFKFKVFALSRGLCCVAFEEITAEREELRSLGESERRLRLILEKGWDIVALATARGRIKLISPNVLGILGYTPEECAGARAMGLVHPDDEGAIRAVLGGVLSGRTMTDAAEIRVRTKAGEWRWFEVRLSNLLGEPGLEAVLLNAREAGERRAMQDELRGSLDEKVVLLKEVHHRVKNNFQVITSLLNLQSSKIREAAVRSEFAEAQNRIRAMALIHEKLYKTASFARVEFGLYIESLVGELASVHGAKPKGVAVDVGRGGIPLDIDAAVPCGLFVNEAASNAFKYAFPEGPDGRCPGGRLSVRLSAADGEALIEVEDNGPGIPPGTNTAKPSTLGLSLLRLLAEQLEGAAEIGPGAGGRGLRVALRFPLRN